MSPKKTLKSGEKKLDFYHLNENFIKDSNYEAILNYF